MGAERTREVVIERLNLIQASLGGCLRERLRVIADLDRFGGWEAEGARDLAHYLCINLGVSEWKARRLIACAHALERLPRIAEALACGALSEEKVVELTRFAQPETEADLVRWAQRVSGAWIRRRADLMERQSIEEARAAERERRLDWCFAGHRFHLELDVPKAEGLRIVRRVQQTADCIPAMPDEEGNAPRLADAAVVLLTSGADGAGTGATVVIHARLDDLIAGDRACSLEGEAIHPETARRFACHSRFQLLLESEDGEPLRLGRVRRDPTPSMRRVLDARDGGCTFPGCGTKRFTEPHHIRWWASGGPTDLDSLALLCSVHHKLVHEYGWRLERADDDVRWFRPDGTRYRAGPMVPVPPVDPRYAASG